MKFCGIGLLAKQVILLCLWFSHSSILEFGRGSAIKYSPRASSIHQNSARPCLERSIFPFLSCRSMCFDFIILVFGLFAFSTLAFAFQFFTHKHFLQISVLRICTFTCTRFPIQKLVIDSASSLLWKLVSRVNV